MLTQKIFFNLQFWQILNLRNEMKMPKYIKPVSKECNKIIGVKRTLNLSFKIWKHKNVSFMYPL